jgi:UDP-3-O-[3-hydroxymyristoyl] glucosamine N-acyltransferase
MDYTVGQIAALLELEFSGNANHLLTKVARYDTADESSLVFLQTGEATAPRTAASLPGCIIASKADLPPGINIIFSENPKLDFSRAAAFLHPRPKSSGTRDETAWVHPDADVGKAVEIGPFAVVGAKAHIGDGAILHARTVVGEGCVVGDECILHPGVVLYPGAQLGMRVVLHSGVVVGADGFGYVSDRTSYWKFPQVGTVVIENDVEVGCNSTIDRGSLGITRIGEGTKIDNLVQIAHNVEIGKHVVIAAQTGISGSTVIEDHAVIGGQVGFGDHARVQAGAVIGSKAGVLPGKIVRSGDVYWGVPVRPLREYKRLNALFGRLPEMKAEIDALKKQVASLQALLDKDGK